jgi:RsiW-degrading membrane proteinase PrsW (M82 family)
MRGLVVVAVALLPALLFLLALVWLDSYKLTRPRTVLAVLAAGGLAAVAAYGFNGLLLSQLGWEFGTYSRSLGPAVEETLKAAIILALFQRHRIGFLVDAAILGFATGAGFAVVENCFYMVLSPGISLGTWVVRGLGTAIMHGAVTSMLAVLLLLMSESQRNLRVRDAALCLLAAVALHTIFNQFFVSPLMSTIGTLLVLPTLLLETYRIGQRRLGRWLGTGFDADAQMLELLESGDFSSSPPGRYLQTLQDRFPGPVVADLLCYVRLSTELALRAKGLLMARETGFDVALDDSTEAKFAEMEYLESSIGKTGLLAIRPVLHATRRDLWQLNMLHG